MEESEIVARLEVEGDGQVGVGRGGGDEEGEREG